MLREGLLSVEVEVEASSSVAATVGSVAPTSPARRSGIRVVVVIVGGRHSCGSAGDLSIEFKYVYRSRRCAMWFMMVVVAASI